MEIKYDINLDVSKDDFVNNRIAEIANKAEEKTYNELGGVFRHAALDFKTQDLKSEKICWMLYEVCTLSTVPIDNPYGPSEYSYGVACSKGILDFTDSDMRFFESILPNLTNALLRGRIADMVWIRDKKKYEMALEAIKSFVTLPIERDIWFLQNKILWERAILLAIYFRKKSLENHLEIIKQQFLDIFFGMSYGKETLTFWGSICLTLQQFDIDEELGKKIIEKISRQIAEAQASRNPQEYRYCCNLLLSYQKKFQFEDQSIETVNALAESFAEEAQNAEQDILGACLCENAIRKYRKIPAKYRSKYDVNSKIHNMRRLMRQKHLASAASMEEIKIYFKDILTEEEMNECFRASKAQIAGKNMNEALAELLHAFPGIDEEKKWKEAKELVSKSITPMLLGGKQVLDGRVTASAPVVNLADLNSNESKDRMWYEILRFYPMDISLGWILYIAPALEQFNSDHKISEEYLLKLCESSRTVPVGRASYWAKGLFFGFQGDFSSAIHILVPQIENWIREFMWSKGLNTSTFNSDTGIESENGLSALLDVDGLTHILNKNLLFELKALMTTPPGPNLRNEIAHGLIAPEKANSAIGAYQWWLALRLMLEGV